MRRCEPAKLAYVYFEEEPGRRSAAKLLKQRRGAADRSEYRQVTGVKWPRHAYARMSRLSVVRVGQELLLIGHDLRQSVRRD